MALSSTLYRFTIKLSDVDRGRYETLELRVAMHPSEATPFLLTRVIAYALNVDEGIEFTQGIASSDDPAIRIADLTGILLLWIDVGNPSARRLHKASKMAKRVRVYTYREPEILLGELKGKELHDAHKIEIFSLEARFLNEVGQTLERDNAWELLVTEGEISLTVKGKTLQGEVCSHALG